MKYDFIADPGHGWLKVKRKEVEALGIHVSPFSYQRGEWVYLEEGADLYRFVKAKGALGESLQYRVRTAGERASRVRNYESFRPVNVPKGT